MIFPKEFKEAIHNLPSAEKDKLIFRLLKKDLVLANQLMFQLVVEDSIEEQREKLRKQIDILIDRAANIYYSPGYLNMDIRDISGRINEHVQITKDKYGEISLNLYMINNVLEKNNKNILSATPAKAKKLCTAVIARAFKILILIKKMHEDYFTEFEDDIKKLGALIGDNPYLMKSAIFNGLDINWLLSGNIPDDIEQIRKELRQKGYL